MAYLLPSSTFTPLERDGYVYVAGPKVAWITRVRRVDIEAVRDEARERRATRIEWWLGPSSPGLTGIEPGTPPTLTGMTCTTEPPSSEIEVREAEPEELVALEHAVWGGEPNPPLPASSVERLYAAVIDGRAVGGARAVDMHGGVALMGGVVLPEARGRGVYRALVHARWLHAVERGTPCLVVQAGEQSAPILTGLGFASHCELRLYVEQR